MIYHYIKIIDTYNVNVHYTLKQTIIYILQTMCMHELRSLLYQLNLPFNFRKVWPCRYIPFKRGHVILLGNFVLSEPTVHARAASRPTVALRAVNTGGLVPSLQSKLSRKETGDLLGLQPSLNRAQGGGLSLAPGPARPSPPPRSDGS